MAEQGNEGAATVESGVAEVERLIADGEEGPDDPQVDGFEDSPPDPLVGHPDGPVPEAPPKNPYQLAQPPDHPFPGPVPLPLPQARMAVATALLTASSFMAQVEDLGARLEPLSRHRGAVEAARGKLGEAYNLLAAAAGLLRT